MISILSVYMEPIISGITKAVSTLLANLDRHEYDFKVIVCSDDYRIGEIYDNIGIECQVIPFSKYFSWKGIAFLRKELRKDKWNIVHLHNLQTLPWGWAGVRNRSAYVIFTPHVDHACHPVKDFMIGKTLRYLVDREWTIISLSSSQKGYLQSITNKGSYVMIPNGIADPQFEGMPSPGKVTVREEIGIPANALIVCQTGRIDKQKNPQMLLGCAKRLKGKQRIHFVIVGDGPMFNDIRRRCKEMGLDRFHMLGYRQDILKIMAESDIISLTSIYEGCPFSLLEAAGLGLPAVGTDVTGITDLIITGKTGLIVPLNDDKKMAEAIFYLDNNPEVLSSMGKCAREYFLKKHLLTQMVSRYDRLYKSIKTKSVVV